MQNAVLSLNRICVQPGADIPWQSTTVHLQHLADRGTDITYETSPTPDDVQQFLYLVLVLDLFITYRVLFYLYIFVTCVCS